MTRNLLPKNEKREFQKEFYGFFTIFLIRYIDLTATIAKLEIKSNKKG